MFLANYMVNGDKPVPINQAHRFAMADSVAKTYRMVARGPVNLNNMDVSLGLRDQVLRGIVSNGADVNFVKTHNMSGTIKGKVLIPNDITRSAIYIVRNPLDVLLSYARHFGFSHEQAAQALSRRDNWIEPSEDTVAQFLGRWDLHVKGWERRMPFPVLFLRYEDLLEDAEAQFSKLLEHVGIPVDRERLRKAVAFSNFEELSAQEGDGGFDEKSQYSKAFFSKGQSDQWKTDLAPELVEKVRAEHGKVMKKYGYLDE